MSPDPAEPQSLHDLVEAFAQTSQAVLALARACSDDDLGQPTECPGWTVHDQISHVVGVEARLGGHKDPRVELPSYEHIRNDLGKRVEYAVEVRRGRTGPELVAELEGVLAERLSTLRRPTLSDTSIMPGPFGPDEATTVLLLRTFDVWVHEQDIRSALGRPGNLDSPAAAVCVGSVIRLLPKLIARGAGLTPGSRVVIDVTGPGPVVAARQGVQIELDEQDRLRGRAISADTLSTNPLSSHQVLRNGDSPRPTEEPQDHQATIISLTTEAFTRRAAGRRAVSDTEYSVVGDDAIARRVLEALVVTQ